MSDLVPYRPNDQRADEAPPVETQQASTTRAQRFTTHLGLAIGVACLIVQYDNWAYPHGPINWINETFRPDPSMFSSLGPIFDVVLLASISVLLARLCGKDRYMRGVWLIAATTAFLTGCLNALGMTQYNLPMWKPGEIPNPMDTTIICLLIGGGYLGYLGGKHLFPILAPLVRRSK